MSKVGVVTTPAKPDSNQFNKDLRGSNTSTPKDEKRPGDSLPNQASGQAGRGSTGALVHNQTPGSVGRGTSPSLGHNQSPGNVGRGSTTPLGNNQPLGAAGRGFSSVLGHNQPPGNAGRGGSGTLSHNQAQGQHQQGRQNQSHQNQQQRDRDRQQDNRQQENRQDSRQQDNRNDNRNDSSGGHQNDRKPQLQESKTSAATTSPDVKEENSADLQSKASGEKKFTGRSRLFVGNLTPDVTEDDFRNMFSQYGEVSEVYVNSGRGFGFIRLDYRHNAEAAKAALDGVQKKGRVLRVRFASHGAALRVKNLHPYVSNELLEQSFSQFGDLERCVVIVDDRGKPTGEGIVEFVRKPGANSALRRITEGVFLMGAEPKPITVEPLEQKDEEDGLPEKFLTKTDQYKKEREKEPRFAPPGTFEYEFGMRWKQLEDLEKQQIERVKKDTEEGRLKLEDEMQNALYEYQAEQIRQDLRRQQEELMRLEELRKQDMMRRHQEHEMRRQQEDRERAQQDERRRADTMMLLRQQDISRGRGPLDIPGMRGRDDLLMQDRYGDRMLDRLPERMNDRLPDRMGDRLGDRMGDRINDRMGDRMAERLGDRMGDRMGERMGDRLGQGPAGFMWDEKQREAAMRADQAAMRADQGRGRAGVAPPLQPPPVPPSSVNEMERGGPPSSGPGPSGKTSPKPLMQLGGLDVVDRSGPNGGGANSANLNNSDARDSRRSRYDQGGPDASFQNQRGVLGAPPGGIGSLGGAGGPGSIGGSQGALGGQGPLGSGPSVGNSGRGGSQGFGGGSSLFQAPGTLSDRLLMDRRREAARDDFNDIKRMRRF